MLLTGRAPFHGNSLEEIFNLIKKGEFSYDGIDQSARVLLKEMLQVDQKKRITASEALKY